MINFKDKLNREEKNEIRSILDNYQDYYSDFYVTNNNMRIFLKENLSELFDAINKKKDRIVYDESGVILTYGLNTKYRTYLKIIGDDVEGLLKALLWNVNGELYIKVKKTNPIVNLLNKYDFKVAGYRGKELLLKRGK